MLPLRNLKYLDNLTIKKALLVCRGSSRRAAKERPSKLLLLQLLLTEAPRLY